MRKNEELVELMYQSEAVNDMGVMGLMRILNVSVTSNKRDRITGVLFYDKGHFGQILEGPRTAIEALWERIQKDPRHHQVELLGLSPIMGRRFSQWALKLFDGKEFAGYVPQFSDAIGQISGADGETLSIMKTLGFEV